MDIAPTTLLQTAHEAATAAAECLQGLWQKELQVTMKESRFDPVTEADIQAQECIVSVIRKAFPDHTILAEEDIGSTDTKESPYRWIVDPLDGTRNFMLGREGFGTIVAVEHDNTLLAGCMVLPLLGYTFTAAKGEGAFVNNKPITLRKTSGMNDAVICSNITRRAVEGSDGILRTAMPYCASIENYGCTAEAIGNILLGWNDGIFVKGLRLWDVAAGFLMLEEAGGKFRYEWMDPENQRGGIIGVGATAPIFTEICSFAFDKHLA